MSNWSRLVFTTWLAMLFGTARGATVTFEVTVPRSTPADARVYIAGSSAELGEWQAAGRELQKVKEGRYQLTLDLPEQGSLEYKFTLGHWDSVEQRADGSQLPNRIASVKANSTIKCTVAAWASTESAPTVKQHTLTGNIRSLDDFESRILDNRRPVWVYLPPDYDLVPDRRYPVLYMHDGQNVFDDATSFAGEWRADEIAEALINEGKIKPIIIVAVANAGVARIAEYTPVIDLLRGEGGNGDKYARFLMTELKPFIDKTYRTSPEREFTGVCGSSLGGLISLHIARTYPDVVGLCGAMSPSLWWANMTAVETVRRDAAWTAGCRIWLDMGTAEGNDPDSANEVIRAARDYAEALHTAGRVREKDFKYVEAAGAAHNEAAWSERFRELLIFFFPR
ncbi:MAG TPA: alpha/beta hydrolase-fold protein [Tepidisphaeraceae bacterium]|nr:alpha/beta hydrolase-fold protein [Tepidisphaeraceae bacterium]